MEKSHQDGIIDRLRTKNSMTQEMKVAQHSRREHKQLLQSMRSITKEVNHKTKKYEKIRDENGVQTKKVREDALLLTMQHDGIYLKHRKEIYYQEAAQKKEYRNHPKNHLGSSTTMTSTDGT
jgi:hypothetical protein